ncbi:MAG: copper-binding protein [Burkholderiales bacterium]|nr:copper-binding protein [Burkholderiales bacterium]
MKKIAIASLVFVAASVVFAQSKMDEMKGMGMDMAKKPAAGAQTTHEANGTIKKIDAQKGWVTIAHGPVNSLSWPPMTMSFKIKDKSLLAKLALDKKVDFGFVKEGDDYVMTTVK